MSENGRPATSPHSGAKSAAPGRIAVTRAEAAASLGMSVDALEKYVQPNVKIIRCGRLRLIPVVELERWARENAAHTLGPA